MKRRTVNLTDPEAEALERYSVEDSARSRALASLAGEEAMTYSDSGVVRALIKVGMERVEERLLEEGYRLLAESEDDEDRAFAKAGALMAAHLWEEE